MENPLSGMELFVGAVVGLVGFLAVSLTDRALATRESAIVKSPSAPIYMDFWRLGAAVGFSAVPLIGAHYVRSPLARAGMQFFGVAALLYLTGKVAQDLGGKLLADNDTGKRLFGGEIAAQDMLAAAEKTKTNGTAGLPDGAEDVPPPPAFTGGQPSPQAMEAVRQHAPAIRALAGLAADIDAMNGNRATGDQINRIEAMKKQYASSLAALGRFHHAELQAAIGLAGITSLSRAAQPKPQPQGAPPLARAPHAPPSTDDDEQSSPYSWASND
jgi:hypothetical protein